MKGSGYKAFFQSPVNSPNSHLLDFFVNCVFVTVGAELFEFQPRRRVAAVFGGGVSRDAL